jgi:hypothetical protein
MKRKVYILECDVPGQERGPIKIGWACDPDVRLAPILRSCPYPARLLIAIDGTKSDEHKLHEMLADYQLNGEWFEPAEAVVELVDQIVEAEALPFESIPFSGTKHPATPPKTEAMRAEMADMIRRVIVADVGERTTLQMHRIAEVTGLTFGQVWRIWYGRGSIEHYDTVKRHALLNDREAA